MHFSGTSSAPTSSEFEGWGKGVGGSVIVCAFLRAELHVSMILGTFDHTKVAHKWN